MKLTYCMMTRNRLYDVMRCLERVKPYVDRIVIVDGGSIDDSIFTLRNYQGVELYIHPWNDNFSQQRTHYLTHAGENGGTDWVLVSDPDELYSVEALQNMRKEIENAGRFNMLSFQSVSVTTKGTDVVHKNEDDFWKPLLFKWNPGIHYVGNPHEALVLNGGMRVKNLPYQYYHIKQQDVTWHRGARNAFIAGISPAGVPTKLWKPFRDLVREVSGVDSWTAFDAYLLKGKIDQRIKDALISFKDEKGWDGCSEWNEMYNLYFLAYHPEER
jgi:glycosyltransferase involved in cell wall biosynthesis